MKWTVVTPVESAQGNQVWSVEADTEAEALAAFKRGDGEFVSEEVEVVSIGKPEISPAE